MCKQNICGLFNLWKIWFSKLKQKFVCLLTIIVEFHLTERKSSATVCVNFYLNCSLDKQLVWSGGIIHLQILKMQAQSSFPVDSYTVALKSLSRKCSFMRNVTISYHCPFLCSALHSLSAWLVARAASYWSVNPGESKLDVSDSSNVLQFPALNSVSYPILFLQFGKKTKNTSCLLNVFLFLNNYFYRYPLLFCPSSVKHFVRPLVGLSSAALCYI